MNSTQLSVQNQSSEEIKPTSAGLTLTFKSLFDFLGKTLAVTLSFKDFELTKEESTVLSEQADQVVCEFAPNVNNKWAKLGIFLTSLLSIMGQKWFKFEKSKESKVVNTEENKSVATVREN